MASLREVQSAFAAALRGHSEDATHVLALHPAANLDVYRNNSEWSFHQALALTFPVLRRRVGNDYFRQLATHYRRRHPSRSGDLHWVGRDFAGFLATHLSGSEYLWLADLARLEWAREQASVADVLPALNAEALATVSPEDLEVLVFRLQPSLQLGISDFPVLSVWQANQLENAPPVDQSAGSERYVVLARADGVEVRLLAAPLFSYLYALKEGATLGAALTSAGLDEAGLLAALQFLFAHEMVVEIIPRSGS